MEIHIVKLDHIFYLNELFESVVSLVFILGLELFITIHDWTIYFIGDVIEAGSKKINIKC